MGNKSQSLSITTAQVFLLYTVVSSPLPTCHHPILLTLPPPPFSPSPYLHPSYPHPSLLILTPSSPPFLPLPSYPHTSLPSLLPPHLSLVGTNPASTTSPKQLILLTRHIPFSFCWSGRVSTTLKMVPFSNSSSLGIPLLLV